MIDRGEVLRKVALNVARYTGIAPLLGAYFSGVGAILMLHRVNRLPVGPLGVNRHLTITPEFLDKILADLSRSGYEFVSLDEAVDRVRHGGGKRFIAVTADDAYRDNLTEALPVLERHEAPITIYVSPGLTNREIDLWWDVLEEIVAHSDCVRLETADGLIAIDCATFADKFAANTKIHDYLTTVVRETDRQVILRDLARAAGVDYARPSREALMDWDEVRTIADHPLVTIGAHTVHHYNLKRLKDDAAYREITDAARILDIELGQKPRHMAYPYGYASAVGPREVELARKAGYVSAVTTRHGLLQAQHAHHLHALPRVSVNGRYQHVGHMRTMMSGITTAMANSGRRVVTV